MRDWERYVRGHLALPDLARAREARIVRELAAQLEDFYLDALSRGMTEDEADAHARAQITDWQQFAAALTNIDRPHARSRVDRWSERLDDRARQQSRGWRLLALLSDFWQDLRYAHRRIIAEPGFTAAMVLTLGLGIGLCCLLFAFLNGILLQPLPGAREPERLVSLQMPVAYPYVEQFRSELSRDHGGGVASAITAFIGPVPFNVTRDSGSGNDAGHARPERIFGHIVSLEYFATLGVQPLLGRFFDASASADASAAVVVSERFWRTRLNADPAIVGRTLRINGGHATIIGVASKDFLGVFPLNPADLFVPLTADPALAPELGGNVLTNPNATPFRVVFRLAPGETLSHAREAIAAQQRQLDQRYGKTDAAVPVTQRRPRVQLMTAGGLMPWPPELRKIPIVFFSILIILILSFTCANLGGLMLARGDGRAREIAVRLSLGASRWRLVRQLLTESSLLALAGGAVGYLAAYALFALLVRSLADTQSFFAATRLTPDLRVAITTFAMTALAGTLVGLIPALAATRPDLLRGLRDASLLGTGRHRRLGLRNLFIVYQMTAATALTLVVGFMVSGVIRSASVDLGVDTERLWLFSLDLARDGYTRDEAQRFLLGLPDRLSSVNGVDRVSVADEVPFSGQLANTPITVIDADGRETVRPVVLQRIGPGYFAALGIPVLRGAEFTADQLRATPAPTRASASASASAAAAAGPAESMQANALVPVVINETAARKLFGDREPIGALLRQNQRRLQVVGVARYGKPPLFASEPTPTVMLPLTASDVVPGPAQGLTVIVRSRAGMSLPTIAGALATLDTSASPFNLRTMNEAIQQMDRGVQYSTGFYSILGAFAIGLASIGLAGVTAQAVSRRRKEIGIRVALGAQRWNVVRLVMREAIAMVAIGVGLGLAAAFVVGRVIAAINIEMGRALVSMANPLMVLALPMFLMLVAIVTCYLPARRSSAIDPLVTLREE
jgi:predicted permease